jgi:hypothetical protein
MRRHPSTSGSNLQASSPPSVSSFSLPRELTRGRLKESGQGETPEPLRQQASQLLAAAHHLLHQQASECRALELCLATLQAAGPRALFLASFSPPTLTPTSVWQAGSRTARTLAPRFATALQQASSRSETIRLNTLFALSQLGLPVALWHFVLPSPLPTTVATLLSPGVPGGAPASPPSPPETSQT